MSSFAGKLIEFSFRKHFFFEWQKVCGKNVFEFAIKIILLKWTWLMSWEGVNFSFYCLLVNLTFEFKIQLEKFSFLIKLKSELTKFKCLSNKATVKLKCFKVMVSGLYSRWWNSKLSSKFSFQFSNLFMRRLLSMRQVREANKVSKL